jgi:hypothetical protein
MAGEVMCGSTQLRVSFTVGLSGLFRYANMKSVPGLVTIISVPSNLTSRSIALGYADVRNSAALIGTCERSACWLKGASSTPEISHAIEHAQI